MKNRQEIASCGKSRIALIVAVLGALYLAAPAPVSAQRIPVLRDNPLIEAARIGDMDTLKAAHAAGLSFNTLGQNGQTALHVAAEWGHSTAVRQLLEWGAKPDRRSKTRHTALSYAVLYGHGEVVGLLLAAGANPNRAAFNSEMPLIMAVRHGRGAIVTQLLSGGADVHETDSTGRTALDWAREMRRPHIADALRIAGQ